MTCLLRSRHKTMKPSSTVSFRPRNSEHKAKISPDWSRDGEFKLTMQMDYGNPHEPRIVTVGGLRSRAEARSLAKQLSDLFMEYDARAVLMWKQETITKGNE